MLQAKAAKIGRGGMRGFPRRERVAVVVAAAAAVSGLSSSLLLAWRERESLFSPPRGNSQPESGHEKEGIKEGKSEKNFLIDVTTREWEWEAAAAAAAAVAAAASESLKAPLLSQPQISAFPKAAS